MGKLICWNTKIKYLKVKIEVWRQLFKNWEKSIVFNHNHTIKKIGKEVKHRKSLENTSIKVMEKKTYLPLQDRHRRMSWIYLTTRIWSTQAPNWLILSKSTIYKTWVVNTPVKRWNHRTKSTWWSKKSYLTLRMNRVNQMTEKWHSI